MSKLKKENMPDGRELVFCGSDPLRKPSSEFLLMYTSGLYDLCKENNEYFLVSKGGDHEQI